MNKRPKPPSGSGTLPKPPLPFHPHYFWLLLKRLMEPGGTPPAVETIVRAIEEGRPNGPMTAGMIYDAFTLLTQVERIDLCSLIETTCCRYCGRLSREWGGPSCPCGSDFIEDTPSMRLKRKPPKKRKPTKQHLARLEAAQKLAHDAFIRLAIIKTLLQPEPIDESLVRAIARYAAADGDSDVQGFMLTEEVGLMPVWSPDSLGAGTTYKLTLSSTVAISSITVLQPTP